MRIGGIGLPELFIILIPVIVIVAIVVVCILVFSKRSAQNAQRNINQPMENMARFCSKCGNQISDESTFCPKCGERLQG